jgi:hypothetical protein
MAVNAPLVHYRKEFIPAFAQQSSLLKDIGTREFQSSGNQATFVVSGSRGGTASTRGTNGDIPYNNPANTQITTTLVELHGAYRMTGFNIFASQGNQRAVMQTEAIKDLSNSIDLAVLAALASATQDLTGTGSVALVEKAIAVLGYNEVDTTEADNMFGVISPGFLAYLRQTNQMSSRDYVDMLTYNGAVRKVFRWAGVNWISSPKITGAQTSSEVCYVMHRSALGISMMMGEEQVFAGYDEEQDRSWTRATTYFAAKILQDTGIVKITHDGSAFTTT